MSNRDKYMDYVKSVKDGDVSEIKIRPNSNGEFEKIMAQIKSVVLELGYRHQIIVSSYVNNDISIKAKA